MSKGVVLSRKARNKIKQIFEWKEDIYSVHLKDSEDVHWLHGKTELYAFISKLSVN